MMMLGISLLVSISGPCEFVPAAPPVVIADAMDEDTSVTEKAKTEFKAWQDGKVDHTRYTSKANATLTDDVVSAISGQLKSLGDVSSTAFTSRAVQGDNVIYNYVIKCEKGDVKMQLGIARDGKFSAIGFRPADKTTT